MRGSNVTITRSCGRSTFTSRTPGMFFINFRSQFAHAFIAIFTFSRDFDRFQNRVVGAFLEKWIGRIAISRSCRVHRVLIIT